MTLGLARIDSPEVSRGTAGRTVQCFGHGLHQKRRVSGLREKDPVVENYDVVVAGSLSDGNRRVSAECRLHILRFSILGASDNPFGIPANDLFEIDSFIAINPIFCGNVDPAESRDNVVEESVFAVSVIAR